MNKKPPPPLLATLCARYPQVFTADPKAIKPLKIGIHNDLLALRSELPGASHKKLRQALRYYTKNLAYLRALAAGGERVDLQGKPAGTVTDRERQQAVKQLAETKAKLAAGKATQKAAAPPKAEGKEKGKGKPTETPKPAEAAPAYTPRRPILSLKKRPA